MGLSKSEYCLNNLPVVWEKCFFFCLIVLYVVSVCHEFQIDVIFKELQHLYNNFFYKCHLASVILSWLHKSFFFFFCKNIKIG